MARKKLLGKQSLQPVERLLKLGQKRDRSVHTSDTAIIISYHELSTLDHQSYSCYDKWDEKVRG